MVNVKEHLRVFLVSFVFACVLALTITRIAEGYRVLTPGDSVTTKANGKTVTVKEESFVYSASENDALLKLKKENDLLRETIGLLERKATLGEQQAAMAARDAERWQKAAETAYTKLDLVVDKLIKAADAKPRQKNDLFTKIFGDARDLGLLFLGTKIQK